MQKRSVSGSSSRSSSSGSAVDAMTALTAAVQDLQAAMSAFAGLLAGGGDPGTDRTDRTDMAYSAPDDAAEARRSAFDEQTIRKFDIPNARLRGELNRAETLPFGQNNLAALEHQRATLDEHERRRLLWHEEQLRNSGELSAEEELTLTEETERLATDEAAAAAAVSHGMRMEDCLPALSAGRPAFTWKGRRGDGETGRNRDRSGSDLGSTVGELSQSDVYSSHQSHSQGQEDTGYQHPGDLRLPLSHSPTPPFSSSQAETERLAEAIGRLADAILNGSGRSGSALHPGEAHGGLNGLLQAATIGARPDGYN